MSAPVAVSGLDRRFAAPHVAPWWLAASKRFAILGAGIVAILASLILLGWSLGSEGLASVVPGTVAVKVNTALSLLALSLAWLVVHLGEGRRARVAATALATAAGAIAVATLFEWATKIDLGIDNALIPEPQDALLTVAAGRMAILTACSIAAISAGLILYLHAASSIGHLLRASLGGLVAFVSAGTLLSYAYGANGAFLLTGTTPMGVVAAVMLLGLAMVAAASEPERGLVGVMGHDSDAGRMLRRALPLVLTAAYFLGILVIASLNAGWWPIEAATATRSALELALLIGIFGVLGLLARNADERARGERAKAIEALAESKRLLDETERVSGAGGWELDVRTGHLAWTDETYRIHGVDRASYDPAREANAIAFYTEPDRARLERALDLARAQGTPYDLELDLRTAGGEIRRVRTTGRPVVRAGKVERVHGHIVDVTDLRLAEQALRESEARYRLLAENMGDLVVAASADGPWTYVSPSVRGLLGYEPSEVIGRRSSEFLHPDDLARVMAQRQAVVRAGAQDRFELRFRRKDGSYVWIESTTTPVKDADGRVTQLISVVRDITERKAAEDKVRALNADLEKRVAARTADLEAANKELEAFAYSVSHDLRAPLRAIDGFSHALVADHAASLDPDAQDMLARVRAASQRMGSLIDDVLKLSRVGRADIQRVPVDLSALATQIVDELRSRDPQRRATVEVQPDVRVHGDPALLRIALQNYLDNAWKFTSKRDEARIAVKAERSREGIVLSVEDNGAGFDEAYADKLFGAFQRLHAVTEFPGNGIGLATVRRIVARHGGRAWAKGAVGQGATFSFFLPDEATP